MTFPQVRNMVQKSLLYKVSAFLEEIWRPNHQESIRKNNGVSYHFDLTLIPNVEAVL